jgi:hypothetical protein
MNWVKTLTTSFLLLAAVSATPAQRATELYMPIGESPGLSGSVTIIGTIASVDEAARTITIASDSERWSAEVTESTHIWIDRSKVQKTNEYGSFSDLTEGARVEVLYVGREKRESGPAEWVKVEKPD